MSVGSPPADRALPANLVLYDGGCGLCDRTVRFLLRHDRRRRLRFAPLQGETAARLLPDLGLTADLQTLVLVCGAGTPGVRVAVRSSAVLEILRAIGGPWAWLAVLRLLPLALRDRIYDGVARRRDRWFGGVDEASSCSRSVDGAQSRFLP